MGFHECADLLSSVIDNFLFQTSGAWAMDHGQRGYVDQYSTSGDLPFVLNSKISVAFSNCSFSCDLPCPSLGIIIFSFGSNYHSCPFRGSSSVTLTTSPLPASLIVRSVGRNDSWLSEGPWETSELDAAPV